MLNLFIKFLILLTVWIVWTYHRGTLAPIRNPELIEVESAVFETKTKAAINQLILVGGSDFSRGQRAGELTKNLLYEQESELVSRLKEILPGLWVAKLMSFFSMHWFYGLDHFVLPEMLNEMYGVSQSASQEFDYFADRYTRQLAYHALHEVGQHFVDFGSDVYGCTVFAIPFQEHWVVGRNFDFEGGKIFDEEKVLKWVFPRQGNAYVSVIWAGMVGAVTGVNDKGLYASINAAGSEDFRRLGTPTTLLLTQVLQYAQNLDEAIKILKDTPTFITDIFVLADRPSQRMVKVEKSPLQTKVIELKGPTAITNQLDSTNWAHDSVNLFKKQQLTSDKRLRRATSLLKHHQNEFHSDESIESLLSQFLRDRSDEVGLLPLRHRASIDPLIATHSVIYNSGSGVLFVNEGPGSHGRYIGYNLPESFREKRPVTSKILPADLSLPPAIYDSLRQAEKLSLRATSLAKHGDCEKALNQLKDVIAEFQDHYLFLKARGDVQFCIGNLKEAKLFWAKSLEGRPAYERETLELKRLVEK